LSPVVTGKTPFPPVIVKDQLARSGSPTESPSPLRSLNFVRHRVPIGVGVGVGVGVAGALKPKAYSLPSPEPV
jgi:hypothetical protein